MNEEQKALARKILEQVDREPVTLNMGAWEQEADALYDWKADELVEGCGTTRCMAGWAVHFAAKPGEGTLQARIRIANREDLRGHPWMAVGAYLLGLYDYEAEHLFLALDEVEAVEWLTAKVNEG